MSLTIKLISQQNYFIQEMLAFTPFEDFKIKHCYLSERSSLAQPEFID